jgi:hypothetical protein
MKSDITTVWCARYAQHSSVAKSVVYQKQLPELTTLLTFHNDAALRLYSNMKVQLQTRQ